MTSKLIAQGQLLKKTIFQIRVNIRHWTLIDQLNMMIFIKIGLLFRHCRFL